MEDLQMGHATSSSPETPALLFIPLALTTSHEHSETLKGESVQMNLLLMLLP